MIDFAADIRAIFDDPLGFGEEATYTPSGGQSMSVRVVPIQPDDEVQFGESRLGASTTRFLVAVEAVPTPKSGDVLAFGQETFTVQGRPERDERRTFWRLDTRPA